MIVHSSDFTDLTVLDSALADAAYSPEEVALLEQVLDDVCGRAAQHISMNLGIRSLLASAILEGALLGLRDREQLGAFALRVLPAFRRELADS